MSARENQPTRERRHAAGREKNGERTETSLGVPLCDMAQMYLFPVCKHVLPVHQRESSSFGPTAIFLQQFLAHWAWKDHEWVFFFPFSLIHRRSSSNESRSVSYISLHAVRTTYPQRAVMPAVGDSDWNSWPERFSTLGQSADKETGLQLRLERCKDPEGTISWR